MIDLTSYLTWSIVLITLIAMLYRWRFTYWSRRGVPGPNYIEMQNLFYKHHECTLESLKKYGRVYGNYDIFNNNVTVMDPDLLRDIMVRDFHLLPNRKHFNIGTSKVAQSLFFMDGDEKWKRVRSTLSPAFTSGKLKTMMSHISDISDQFVNQLERFEKNDSVVDMRKYIGAFAMDVISACAYGIRVDSINNPNHPIVTNAKKIFGVDANFSMIISILFPRLAKWLKLEFFDLDATNYFDKLTNEIVRERKKTNTNTDKSKRKTDLIQLMMDSEKQIDLGYDSNGNSDSASSSELEDTENIENKNIKVKETLTPDELTAQSILFFIAGYDTTSASITHTMYYLSLHKDCQKRLYEELQTLSDFSYETLNQLKYLNAVIDESLRLAPSLTRIQRECLQDYKLGNTGITVPAGASIEILPYALHRDPELWPEPEMFKPERFLEPTHHPFAYLPFGGGHRYCIGQRFALNEMRMCIAKLINRFEFSLADGFEIDYFNGSVLMSPKELLVKIKSRN